MSLHNSTRASRKWIILLVTKVEAKAMKLCQAFLQYKFKAQRSGFEFERRNSGAERSFRRQPQAGGGNGE